MKNISILGSTGSIGTQTLDEINKKRENFRILGLTCNSNIKLLSKQINQFQAIQFHANKNISTKAKKTSPNAIASDNKLHKLVVATEGINSLNPTLNALNNSKIVGIANKESLLCGYEFIRKSLQKYEGKLIPLDSEPVSVQNLLNENKSFVDKIIITASGGPFRNKTESELSSISPKEASNHPNWKMGKKISVDSATLMNKAFEVLECNLLFDFPLEKIEVIINPSSNIHALIQYKNNTIIASKYKPDMKIPISEFLTGKLSPFSTHVYFKKHELIKPEFENFNASKFPAYQIGLHYGKRRGSWIIALCAADQAAVELFINHKINFIDIPKIIESVLDNHIESNISKLEDIYTVYKSTINETYKLAKSKWN
jgi:1-deoxy-D-xylulose-5-phosphate reductoisomerase